MDEKTVPSYDLLDLIRAYNEKEISFREWLELSKEWAENIIQSKKEKPLPSTVEGSGAVIRKLLADRDLI